MRWHVIPQRSDWQTFREPIYRVKAAESIHRESQILLRIRWGRSRVGVRALPPAHGREKPRDYFNSRAMVRPSAASARTTMAATATRFDEEPPLLDGAGRGACGCAAAAGRGAALGFSAAAGAGAGCGTEPRASGEPASILPLYARIFCV